MGVWLDTVGMSNHLMAGDRAAATESVILGVKGGSRIYIALCDESTCLISVLLVAGN